MSTCSKPAKKNFAKEIKFKVRLWWWSSGQRTRLVLQRSQLKSCWGQQFSVKLFLKRTKITKKRPRFVYLKINIKISANKIEFFGRGVVICVQTSSDSWRRNITNDVAVNNFISFILCHLQINNSISGHLMAFYLSYAMLPKWLLQNLNGKWWW